MNVCIIPARGGSKRIPKKNIKPFCGHPMISYVIDVAIESNCFDRIICSTDDKEIASIARYCGAEIPFIRPDNLSDDYTTTTSVVAHAVEFLTNEGCQIDYVCCIYPTAVLLQKKDIINSLKILKMGKWDYVFGVTKYNSPVQRSIVLDSKQGVEMLMPEYYNTRSQDLSDVYLDAGMFYWATLEAWIANKKVFDKNSTIVEIPECRSQDIDTFNDFEIAEQKFKQMTKSASTRNA